MNRSDLFEKFKFLESMNKNDKDLNFDIFGVYFRANSAYVVTNNFACWVDTQFDNMKKYGMTAYFDDSPVEDEDCSNKLPLDFIKSIRRQRGRYVNSFSILTSDLIDESVSKKLKNPSHLKNSCINIEVENHAHITINSLKGVKVSEYGRNLVSKKIIRPNTRGALFVRINLYYLKEIVEKMMSDCDIINFKLGQKNDSVLLQGRYGKTSINWIIAQVSNKK